jgi:hypothetical protein
MKLTLKSRAFSFFFYEYLAFMLCNLSFIRITEDKSQARPSRSPSENIVAGIDPTPLGQAPFTLATAEALEMDAVPIELPFRNAQVYLAPCIAGHVGADTAAVILSEGPTPRTGDAGRRRRSRHWC